MVVVAESNQTIEQGSQTLVADQVGGVYIFCQQPITISPLYDINSTNHLDGLNSGYRGPGLNFLPNHPIHIDRT